MNNQTEVIDINEKPIITRIRQEKFELDKNISALDKFLGSVKIGLVEVSETQHDLLKDQLFHMSNYSEVLDKRLKDLAK